MPASALLTDGLVGHWTMDGKDTQGTVTDLTGNGNDGTFHHEDVPASAAQFAAAKTSGKLGQALDFESDDTEFVLKTSSSAVLDLETALTISAWVHTESEIDDDGIFGRGGDTTNDRWYFYLDDGALVLGSQNDPGNFSFAIENSPTSHVGQWVHLVGVMDSTLSGSDRIKLYRNSVELTDKTFQWVEGFGFDSTNQFMDIGATPANATMLFDGKIDDLRIYNRALTPAEVKQLYLKGQALPKPPNNLGLVGYWSFNEGAGTVATDFSGRGNRGILIGSPVPQWVSGKRGSALDFNGISTSNIDAVDVANESNFDFERTQPFTIAAWVNHEGNAHENYVVSKTVVFGEQYNLTIPSNNSVRLKLANTTEAAVAIMTTPANTLTNNRWHHIVATYDGTSTSTGILIYVDGVSQSLSQTGSTAASLSGTILNGQRLAIGSLAFDFADADVGMQGKIDEVRVYNRVLGPSEVKALYGQGTGSSGAVQVGTPVTALQQSSSLTGGLVGHWTFDGPDTQSTITDRSGSGNSGYLYNGATSTAKVSGKLGQALNFDGVNDAVYVAPASSINDLTTLTVSAWIWLDTAPGGNGDCIINKAVSGGGWIFSVDDTSGVKLSIQNQTADTEKITDPVVTLGEWQHVVGVWPGGTQGANIRLYRNGVQPSHDGGGTGSGTHNSDAAKRIEIGDDIGNCPFDGKLDDIRLYNRALTEQEVKQLYRLGQTTLSQ